MERSMTKRETIDLSSQGRPFSGGDVWAETWQVRSPTQVDLEEVPFGQRGQQMHRLWRGKRLGMVTEQKGRRDWGTEQGREEWSDFRSWARAGPAGDFPWDGWTQEGEQTWGGGEGKRGAWWVHFGHNSEGEVDSHRKCPVRKVEQTSPMCQVQC